MTVKDYSKFSFATALQTTGTLSAAIFLIDSIHEVFRINNLYQSQQFLIGILLTALSSWALLEIMLIYRRPNSPPLRGLAGLLIFQLVLVLTRHWSSSSPYSQALPILDPVAGTSSSLGSSIIFLGIYFFTFLAISRFIISAFSYSEASRAKELRKQMQILNITKSALEDSENRYRTFFNLPLVGTAIISSRSGWIALNNQTCEILGYHREDLISKSLVELIHPEELNNSIALIQHLIDRDKSQFQVEKRLIGSDGKIVHALIAGGCEPKQDPEDDILIYLNIINITEQKNAEAELDAAQKRDQANLLQNRQLLEQKLKTSITAAAVAHEIQQPLSSILLNCRLAVQNLAEMPAGSIAAELEARLGTLTSDAEQVVGTMERMRMLLRNVETTHSSVDLAANVHSALVFLRPELTLQQVQVRQEGLELTCPLQGDGAQLQIAVVNLVRNAIQAMEEQPPESRKLRIELQHCPDCLRIVVADSGPGFPPNYSNDTSWELLKSTKATGMGLGLFLAQTAVSNHQGELEIGRCQLLGGAEIVLLLPRLNPDPAADPATP